MTNLDVRLISAEVARLELRPGDKVLVRIKDTRVMPPEEMEMLIERLRQFFGETPVILMAGDFEVSILSKSEAV